MMIKMALQWLLRYDKWDDDSHTRRAEVINRLRLRCSVGQMRRKGSPEYELLAILAESLIPPDEPPAAVTALAA
jgi:hypothetical protein